MKTYKNLYVKYKSKEYIENVIIESLKGKDYKDKIMPKLNNIVNQTYNDILNHNFVLRPVSHRYIKERHKERKIVIAPYIPNKVYDYLLVNELRPIIEKSMYRWCVGNVKYRGKDMGIDYLQKHIKKNKYAISLDIKKYYENIDKEILFNMVKRKIKDKDFLDMYSQVIGNTGKGLELGLNTSQWLSNYLLQDLDYFIKQELKADVYIRYVDDMVILGNNKRKLHYYIREIKRYLKDYLNLELKENYQLLNLVKGDMINFLGYRLGKQRLLLKKGTFNKFVRLYKRMIKHSIKRARTVIALNGWFKKLKHSYLYYVRHLKPIISFRKIINISKGGYRYEPTT